MSRNEQSVKIMKRVVIDVVIVVAFILCSELSYSLVEPFQRGFFCDDESIKYPYKDDTVTVPILRAVGIVPPMIAFLICEWMILRKESTEQYCFGLRIPTWIWGFYCVLASFGLGCCLVELGTNLGKFTIGRLRPHFIEICQPSVNCSLTEMHGRYIQAHEYTCTGTRIDKFADSRKSFPSGHSSWAAYTMIYLALYLESRLSWCDSRSVRHTLQFIAVSLSWYCALSRISDYKHHWSDVILGYIIGTAFAILVWFWGTDLVKKQKNTVSSTSQYDIPITSQPVAVQNGCNSAL